MGDINPSCKSKNKRKRRSRANIKVSVDQISENSDAETQNDFDRSNSNQNSELDTQNPNDDNLNDDEDDERIYTDAHVSQMPQTTTEEYEKEKQNHEENEAQGMAEKQHVEGLHEKIESPSEQNQELQSEMGIWNTVSEQFPVESETANKVKDIFNVRALSKHAKTYELEKFKNKLLIIFNHENVNGYEKPRHGTDKDVKALTTTFEKFGFKVTEYKDRTKAEIFLLMKDFSTQDFTDYGCVGVAVLTHGSEQGLLCAKDYSYSEMEIIDHFKVHDKPTLVTKPKFLIIQACRGMKIIPGTPVHYASKKRTELDASTTPYFLPVEADMLIIHSSYNGTPSHRVEGSGSWFIESLCKQINQHADELDFENIITEVKREVAIEYQNKKFSKITYKKEVYKQMPVMTSTLIRKLYLKEFGDSSPLPSVSVTDCASNDNNTAPNEVPATTSSSLQVQDECLCFLQHFDYITNCLRYYCEENPQDGTARSFLDVAEAYDEKVNLNAKYQLAKGMCAHLSANAKDCPYYKFLYFYKHF